MTIKEDNISSSPSQYGANNSDSKTEDVLADKLDLDFVGADSTEKASTQVETSTPKYADGLDFAPPDEKNDADGNKHGEYGGWMGQQHNIKKEQDIERADDANTDSSSSLPEDYSSNYELNEEDERRIRRNRRVRGFGGSFCLIFFLFFFFGRAWWWGRAMEDNDGSQNDDDLVTPETSFAPSMAPSLVPEAEMSSAPTNN